MSHVRLEVPPGSVARVRLIDTTTSIKTLKTHHLIGPPMPGMDVMPDLPGWSFLVESPDGRKALFDLGIPPNYKSFSPWVLRFLEMDDWGWQISSEKHVANILESGGVDPASITDIVWSHWHWDHIGDPSTFPCSTRLVVGPGFKDAFLPAYPVGKDSPVRQSDFEGRELYEVDFNEMLPPLRIGQFQAYDLFGNGSFYLLDTPGHAIGHLAGLARTSPDTFVMMGGDLCHHAGVIRPSSYVPLPAEIRLNAFHSFPGSLCPVAKVEKLQHSRGRRLDEPFFTPNFAHHMPSALETISKAQASDADSNVLFIYAHDPSVRGVVSLFPEYMNDWKAEGWRDKLFWKFLEDFKDAIID